MTDPTPPAPPAADGTAPATARGQCLCGAVRFTARLPSKWVAHCHCTRCQRAHGAAFVTWVGFRAERVAIDADGDALRWYESDAGGTRGFCTRCGSPMFFRAPRWAGELHVARALFVDAVDKSPTGHVFDDTRVDWVTLSDGLPALPADD